MLKLENVTVRYGQKTAAENISLHLTPGQWLMLCGPNGAGKSTLIRAVSQSVPYEGTIFLYGEDIRRIRSDRFARAVGVLPQHNSVGYAFTVEEIVRMGRYAHRRGLFSGPDREDEARVEQALRDTGLTALRRSSVLSLSGGELQRVFLAQVFAQDPDILVLDEPVNHLDLQYQQHIFSLITGWLQGGKRAVISVVHDLGLARRFGTGALLMHRGRCAAQGTMDEVLTPERLRAVYEMDVYGWMQGLLAPWKEE